MIPVGLTLYMKAWSLQGHSVLFYTPGLGHRLCVLVGAYSGCAAVCVSELECIKCYIFPSEYVNFL